MVTKTWDGGHLQWGAPTYKVTWLSDYVILWQLRSLFLHYQSAFDQQYRRDGNLPGWNPTHKVTWPFYHVIFRDNVAKRNHYISTTTVPIATKFGSMMGLLLEGLLNVKSHDSLITWFCEIPWQTKNVVFPILQCLVSPNLVGWWHKLRSSYPESHLMLWTRGLARLRWKQKPLYLHYQNA